MSDSIQKKFEQVQKLNGEGKSIKSACDEVGLSIGTYNYHKQKAAGSLPKKTRQPKVRHTTIHVQRDDSLIAEYQSATLEFLNATTRILKLTQLRTSHGNS